MIEGSNPVQRKRKLRLLQMVDVARVYRGCSKHEIASVLDRDPAKIIPDSGNPKLDLVVGLAGVLNWSVADVVDAIWNGAPGAVPCEGTFDELNAASIEAHRAGDYERMLSLGQQMYGIAKTPRERALAAMRQCGAFESTGQYVQALRCIQTAVAEPELPEHGYRLLRANLAACHYALCNLVEARAIAIEVGSEFAAFAPMERADRSAEVIAFFVQGAACRRMFAIDRPIAIRQAAAARESLVRAMNAATRMSEDFGDPSYTGIANTCRGAILELDVEVGGCRADLALEQIVSALGQLTDVSAHPRGDMLESWGWWAIFGCNIAQRHLHGPGRERALAILSNKASEIAERQGNWSLREQVFTLEFIERCREGAAEPGERGSWVIDSEDLRNLIGTMGRFPHFRSTGWDILATAQVIGMSGGAS